MIHALSQWLCQDDCREQFLKLQVKTVASPRNHDAGLWCQANARNTGPGCPRPSK
jgi:hypothetical protein